MDATEEFERHRGVLFGVAYRMLGSVDEAEDAVQEAWLRWSRAASPEIEEPKAYLVRVVARAAYDQLRRGPARHETYVGPWLPEPLLTSPDVADTAALADSVSMALLVVLETLSPLERAVFVLREAFGFSYPEIATALDRSEAAVRQVGHRAREHVEARRPRFSPDRSVRTEVTQRFLSAAMGGDLSALLKVLSPDVMLVSDAGGQARAPRREIHGADKVARLFAAIADDALPRTTIRFTDINGVPGAVAEAAGVPYGVIVVDPDPETGLIAHISLIMNPAKLSGVR